MVTAFAIDWKQCLTGDALPHNPEVVRDALSGGRRLRRLLDPARLFLDHPYIAGGPLIGYQLLDRGDLLGHQVDIVRVPQHRPPQCFGMSLLTALLLADLVQRFSEGLHDMEPIDRPLGVGGVLGHAA